MNTEEAMAETDSIVTFKRGDIVRNTNPRSRYYDMVGTFQRVIPWVFCTGLACDVLVEGMHGPYGYPFVLMSLSDLELVEKSNFPDLTKIHSKTT